MNSQPSIGYISLLLVVFGRQLCLPLPADLLLVAAGALVAGGRMSLPLVLCIGVSGCLAGDLVWFRAGRRWGSKVLHILCNFTGDPVRCTQRAHTSFARWGLKLLLIAKFIPGMDAIAPPIAGMEGSPLPSFVAFDAIGSLLWSGFYVGLGFYFSHELTIASRVASHFAIAFALLIGCPLAIMVTWRITKLFHMIRRLRLRTISPHSLREKLRTGGTIALIDLLNFEETGPAVEGIPGAVRIAPARLRIRDKVFMPRTSKLSCIVLHLGNLQALAWHSLFCVAVSRTYSYSTVGSMPGRARGIELQRLSAHRLRAMPSWGSGSLNQALQKVISQNDS